LGDYASTIVFSLQAIARQAGYDIDVDDLRAALGLPWMTTAAPFEKDLGRWPMYARDAFLVEGARLFGMTVRGVHPPEAARGLERLPEFRQHFVASYRPLILNALENRQAVLAWRGWPGEYEPCWGVITQACEEGIGLAGTVRRWVDAPPYLPPRPTTNEPDQGEQSGAERSVPRQSWSGPDIEGRHLVAYAPLVLESPPVQVYVIETISPTQPKPGEVLNVALTHARCVLNNELQERFGVLTGPPAYDAWIERCHEAISGAGAPPADLVRGHEPLAAAVIASHRSAIRFLEHHKSRATGEVRALIEALGESSHVVVTSLEKSGGGQSPPYVACPTAEGIAATTDMIAQARAATNQMRDALQTRK
jgi:hypothetical protein